MQLTLDEQYRPMLDKFLHLHPSLHYTLRSEAKQLRLEIEDSALGKEARRQIRLHFKYLSLFTWEAGNLDDVVFWERPELFPSLVADFAALMADLGFERLAALEARGFLLGGLLGQGLQLSIYPVRKDKPFYRRFRGERISFINWKGAEEALFLFARPYLSDSRVLIVDDLIETGNSLAATIAGLERLGATVAGAFFLCDLLQDTRRAEFGIPIRAFVSPGKRLLARG